VKLYVLSVGIYSGRSVEGVYSTLEAAQRALPERGRGQRVWEPHQVVAPRGWPQRPTWTTKGYGSMEDQVVYDDEADIEEWELDAPYFDHWTMT
jgi:hypothetical protein